MCRFLLGGHLLWIRCLDGLTAIHLLLTDLEVVVEGWLLKCRDDVVAFMRLLLDTLRLDNFVSDLC